MIRIELKDRENFEKSLRETIVEKIPPMEIEIDCPYAQYVEFGSEPAIEPSSRMEYDYICNDFVTLPRLRIRDWAQHKLYLDSDERKTVGDRIYHSIMDNGVPPNPFIRPTIHKAIEMYNNNPEDLIVDDSLSVSENIALWMEWEMKRLLAQRGYGRDTPIRGGKLLIDSITVRNLRTSSVRVKHAESNKIPESAWRSDTSDRHGANKGR